MDRQLAERMVGAACLLAVLVLVVPSILDGNQEPGRTVPEPVLPDAPDLRTHTLSLDSEVRVPPVPQPRELPTEAAVVLPDNEAPAGTIPVPVPVERPEVLPPAAEKPAAVIPPVASQAGATPSVEQAAAGAGQARAAPDAGQWYVQLGSFASKQNAEGLAKKLQAGGFSATVRKSSNGAMLRVLVGPRADREAAVALADKLKAAGFAGQVTKL
jgi:DedD protein